MPVTQIKRHQIGPVACPKAKSGVPVFAGGDAGVADGSEIHLVGHSHGAIIISCALDVIADGLAAQGLSRDEAKAVLGRVTVETYGGAAQRFVDGPRYTHVVNKLDGVPMLTGVGLDRVNPFGRVGAGATIKTFVEAHRPRDLPSLSEGASWVFARAVDKSVHGPRDIYFKHRK